MFKQHFTILFVLFFSSVAYGAYDPDLNSLPFALESIPETKEIQIETEPEFPKPHQLTRATLKSSTFNLANSKIIWTVNGNIQKEGGKLEFETGDLFDAINIVAFVITNENQVFAVKKTIFPRKITVLYEADGYLPAFYRGRSQITYNAPVKISVIAEIPKNESEIYKPEEILYVWQTPTKKIDSGYGKTLLSISSPEVLESDVILVYLFNKKGRILGKSGVRLKVKQPKIMLYENTPLEGIRFSKTLFNSSVSQYPVKISAVPFFVNNKIVSSLLYSWYVNSKELSSKEKTVTIAPEGEGELNIKVKATDPISKDFFNSETASLKLEANYVPSL